MNVQDAAVEILKGAGKPLHAKEIAERIIAAGLWQSAGKTPDATVSARLYSGIKSNGEKSAFVKVGPQTVALRNSFGTLKNSGKSVPPSVEKIQKSLYFCPQR